MNTWLNPLQRSYQAIKDKLLSEISKIKDPRYPGKDIPLITDLSEGNILVLLISLFSAIAEMIHLYIDNLYRESFLSTATRYESVVNHLKLIDYRASMATASVVDVVFTRDLNSNTLNTSVEKIWGSLTITDSSNNSWVLDEPLRIPKGVSSAKARFIQHRAFKPEPGIIAKDSKGKPFTMVENIPEGQYLEQGTLNTIQVNGERYTSVDTFAYSKKTDKHFRVEVIGVNTVVIRFGDGKFGYSPQIDSEVIFGPCYITSGFRGNIPANSLTALTTPISGVTVSNPTASSGGTDYEDLEALKFRAPLSVKTLGVAITKDDIVNLARQVQGVSRAEVEYICGQYINVYISGIGNQESNQGLCDKVKENLSSHLPQNTHVEVKPLANRILNLNLRVTGKPSYDSTTIQNEILTALYNAYNVVSTSVLTKSAGTGVRISDMYALIDNLASVDYFTIRDMYITPWLQPLNGVSSAYISDFKLNLAKGNKEYLLTFKDSSNFIIYPIGNPTDISILTSNGSSPVRSFEGSVGTPLRVNDEIFDFQITIESGSFRGGDNYKFQVMEGNKDVEVEGFFNITVDTSKVTLDIIETV